MIVKANKCRSKENQDKNTNMLKAAIAKLTILKKKPNFVLKNSNQTARKKKIVCNNYCFLNKETILKISQFLFLISSYD